MNASHIDPSPLRPFWVVPALGLGLMLGTGLEATAEPVGLGAAADYALFAFQQDAAAGSEFLLNSMNLLDGDVGLGPGVAGPTSQKVSQSGTVYQHTSSTAVFNASNYVASGGVVQNVPGDGKLAQAADDAVAASEAYAAVGGISLGTLTTPTLVDGTGGGDNYYTIDALDFNDDTLTIRGNADDFFVFNVLGTFSYFQSQIILDGVDPSHVLFNFPTAGGEILFSKAEDVVYGTVLTPYRDIEYHNPATFVGAIVGGRSVNLHGMANITHAPFVAAGSPDSVGTGYD